jgi:hypothetical protein
MCYHELLQVQPQCIYNEEQQEPRSLRPGRPPPFCDLRSGSRLSGFGSRSQHQGSSAPVFLVSTSGRHLLWDVCQIAAGAAKGHKFRKGHGSLDLVHVGVGLLAEPSQEIAMVVKRPDGPTWGDWTPVQKCLRSGMKFVYNKNAVLIYMLYYTVSTITYDL